MYVAKTPTPPCLNILSNVTFQFLHQNMASFSPSGIQIHLTTWLWPIKHRGSVSDVCIPSRGLSLPRMFSLFLLEPRPAAMRTSLKKPSGGWKIRWCRGKPSGLRPCQHTKPQRTWHLPGDAWFSPVNTRNPTQLSQLTVMTCMVVSWINVHCFKSLSSRLSVMRQKQLIETVTLVLISTLSIAVPVNLGESLTAGIES